MKSTAAWVTQPLVTVAKLLIRKNLWGLYNNTFIAVSWRVCPWQHKSHYLPLDICGSSTFLYSVFRKKSYQYCKTLKPVYLVIVYTVLLKAQIPATVTQGVLTLAPWVRQQQIVQIYRDISKHIQGAKVHCKGIASTK